MSKYGGNTQFFQKSASSRLGLRDVFSDIFKKHSRQDGERLFKCGTSTTTPAPGDMLSQWQKPWLFIWVLGFGVGIMLLLITLSYQGGDVFAIIPLSFIGSFIVPLAVLIFYFEMNIPRNIPIYDLLIMLLVGGGLSIIFTIVLGRYVGKVPPYLAPLTEEPAKLLALCLFLRKPTRRYILNGILIGGAIGAGFAAIETSGYFVATTKDSTAQGYATLLSRGLLAPGGHVLWAAIYGGALSMVVGGGKLSAAHFADINFLKYFAASFMMHFLWNTDISLVPLPYVGDIKFILLTAAGWVILLSVIKKGIIQVLQVTQNDTSSIKQPALAPLPSGETLSLYCVSGLYAGQSIPLSGGRVTIGRDAANCNLLYPEHVPGVSRQHCTVAFDGLNVTLCDGGSSYGTYLNTGLKLPQGVPVALKEGESFRLADSGNVFEIRRI